MAKTLSMNAKADDKLKHINAEVDKRAHDLVQHQLYSQEVMYDQRRKLLETQNESLRAEYYKQYKIHTMTYDFLVLCCVSYSFITTIFEFFQHDVTKTDFVTFWKYTWVFIKTVFSLGYHVVNDLIGDWAPGTFTNSTTLQHIGYILIIIVLTLIIWFMFYGCVMAGIVYGTYYYIKHIADITTLKTALLTLIICVYFGSWIHSWLPINLTLLWIAIQWITAAIRKLRETDEQKY